VKLVGLDEARIVRTAERLITDRRAYRRMATATNPYGDGRAAQRTVQIIKRYFGMPAGKVREFVPR
jgi:UDP-N-acetylglucosamine 2-epimerase (non-hydrolysing)